MATTRFIDIRPDAEAEAKAQIRTITRQSGDFGLAAMVRRADASFSLRIAAKWKQNGQRREALQCLKIARGHLIIARALEAKCAASMVASLIEAMRTGKSDAEGQIAHALTERLDAGLIRGRAAEYLDFALGEDDWGEAVEALKCAEARLRGKDQ